MVRTPHHLMSLLRKIDLERRWDLNFHTLTSLTIFHYLNSNVTHQSPPSTNSTLPSCTIFHYLYCNLTHQVFIICTVTSFTTLQYLYTDYTNLTRHSPSSTSSSLTSIITFRYLNSNNIHHLLQLALL